MQGGGNNAEIIGFPVLRSCKYIHTGTLFSGFQAVKRCCDFPVHPRFLCVILKRKRGEGSGGWEQIYSTVAI